MYAFISPMPVALKNSIRAIADSVGIKREMRVLQEFTKVMVGSPQETNLKWCLVKIIDLVKWKSVWLLVLYYSDSNECRNMSAVGFAATEKSPSVTCVMTGEDIFSCPISHEKSLKTHLILK